MSASEEVCNATCRTIVGVMGGATCTEQEANTAEEVGRAVAAKNAVLLTGGRGGIMEAASRGSADAGGEVMAVMPGRSREENPPNRWVSIPVYTGMGDGRNVINVLTADVVIAIGGGWGTLSEIAHARKAGKPVVLLHTWNLDHPSFMINGLYLAETATQAVDLAFDKVLSPKPFTPDDG